jgi:hypothetical protein
VRLGGDEINLVNDVVMAIRISPDRNRREFVKELFVQFPTYEVARALDEDLSRRMGSEFSSREEQQRLVAILFALKELGSLTSRDRGRETWFFFDPEENRASDVLRIRLKKSAMLRSIELSKRIMPTLKEAWRRAAGLDDHPRASQKFEVELDPFVSQLARWVDKEVTIQRPEFRAVFRTERLAEICLQLQQNGVAIRTGTEVSSLWATAVAIDQRIGGAKISHSARFTFTRSANVALLDQFQNAVKEHLKRRLTAMLEAEEAFFSLCNMGEIKIASTDPDGHYLWDVAMPGDCVSNQPLPGAAM